MKRTLTLIVSLLFVLGTSTVQAQKNAIDSLVKEKIEKQVTKNKNVKVNLPGMKIEVPADEDELVAYSDSVLSEVDDEWDDQMERRLEQKIERIVNRMDNPIWGIFGIVIAIVAIAFVLLFFLAPFLIVFFIIRYFIKRSDERIRLAEKAIETGQPLPDEVKSMDRQSDEYLRRRGIRNLFLGLGLLAMFIFWDSRMLQGIGALVALYGAGQLYLSHTPLPRNRKNNLEEPEDEL